MSEGEERARLLAAKRVHNLYLVEGRDIVVQYSVYNVGQAAAINVQLTDAGFRYAQYYLLLHRAKFFFFFMTILLQNSSS